MIGENELVKIDDCDKIKCSNCEKELMILPGHKHANTEVLFEVTVDCPFCNDKSFEFNVYGPLRTVPAKGVVITNTRMNGKKFVFNTKKAYS